MEHLAYTEILKTNINILNLQQTAEYLDRHLEELRGSMSVFPMYIPQ